MAVNSGRSADDVSSYAAKHSVPWPIIVDSDRSLEKSFGLKKEISLNNITQVRYISGDGQLKNGRWDDIEGTIKTALEDATWRIDPKTIPNDLRAAWSAVETGSYAKAAASLKAAIKSKDDESKTAAKALYALVKADLTKKGKAAWALGKAGKRWEAYQAIDEIEKAFDGYPIPGKLLASKEKLARLQEIKEEVRANKMLTGIDEMLNSGDEKKFRAAVKRLKTLKKKFPETSSAAVAATKLESVEE